MSIEVLCTGCGQRLRVSQEHAGKLAKCPRCQTTFTVPYQEQTSSAAGEAPAQLAVTEYWKNPEDSGGGKADQWYLRTQDGQSYGPVTKPELDQWMAEGRISQHMEVRQGSDQQWQSATALYPSLARSATDEFAPAATGNPFSDDPSPYRPPSITSGTYHQQHRGGTILAVGIIGLACCAIAGPIAWVMGNTDLGEMNAGRMDPAGRGMTQAGMILGIIGTVQLVLGMLWGAAVAAFGIMGQ